MNWYYVENGERKDPVDLATLEFLVKSGKLKAKDYVWNKTFGDKWKMVEEVNELKKYLSGATPAAVGTPKIFRFSNQDKEKKIYFIRIGVDRGSVATDYGPYNLAILKKLYKENRINSKTYFFAAGMDHWMLLGAADDFEIVFQDIPPKLEESEKRLSTRKPFVARMFIKNQNHVFEGICRDISIGGMQVLVSNFPGDEGDKISINVHPENSQHHFVADGQIVRRLPGDSGFSFRFINLSNEAIQSINNYIGKS